jgi:hypothetical protein
MSTEMSNEQRYEKLYRVDIRGTWSTYVHGPNETTAEEMNQIVLAARADQYQQSRQLGDNNAGSFEPDFPEGYDKLPENIVKWNALPIHTVIDEGFVMENDHIIVVWNSESDVIAVEGHE